MAPLENRVLRVGVIQAGRIVEERHLDQPNQVTVGQEARNTFVIANPQMPVSAPLFEYRNGRYNLLLNAKTEGRVRLENEDIDFTAVRSQGIAHRRGDLFVLPLPDTAKGKVSWGDVTVLFQLVVPVEPEVVEIDSAFHRPWYRMREPLFMGILLTSIFLNMGGATLIFLQPKPVDQELTLDELPDRFAKMMMPPKVPEPEKPKETKTATEDKDQKAKKDETKKETKVASADPVQHKAAIQQKVASKGLLKILGSSGGNGAFQDVLGGSTGSGDIASALAGAGGVGVATSDALATGKQRGGGSGKVAGIGDVGTSGGGNVNLGAQKGEVAVSGRVSSAAPDVDSANVDREALARYVKARLKAIQNCYEKELKRNPTLKGKVVVRFSIGRSGRPGEIEVEENTLGNEAVGACIRTVIRGWVFPFKPEDEVPVAYPFVFSPAS